MPEIRRGVWLLTDEDLEVVDEELGKREARWLEARAVPTFFGRLARRHDEPLGEYIVRIRGENRDNLAGEAAHFLLMGGVTYWPDTIMFPLYDGISRCTYRTDVKTHPDFPENWIEDKAKQYTNGRELPQMFALMLGRIPMFRFGGYITYEELKRPENYTEVYPFGIDIGAPLWAPMHTVPECKLYLTEEEAVSWRNRILHDNDLST